MAINIGQLLASQPQMQSSLGQAMDPQAMASQAQPGGIGGLLAKIRENPAAIQALLSTGANLLNPQTFGSPVGRIASAASQGVQQFAQGTAAAEDREFKRKLLESREAREERKVGQGDRQLDIAEDKLEVEKDQLETENEQFLQKLGLDASQLEAQKKVWAAQAQKYAADAAATKAKAEQGLDENLTGEERIINNLANILIANEMPPDQAYMTAYDIKNKAGEGEAKAIAGVVESLGTMSSTPKGKAIIEDMITEIQNTFRTGSDILAEQKANIQEVAPGVTRGDIDQAISAINANSQTNITWEELTEVQQQNVIKKIQEAKGGQ